MKRIDPLHPPIGKQLPLIGAVSPSLAIGAPIVISDDHRSPSEVAMAAGTRHKRRGELRAVFTDPPSIDPLPGRTSIESIVLPVPCASCGGGSGERVAFEGGRAEVICACGNMQSLYLDSKLEDEA